MPPSLPRFWIAAMVFHLLAASAWPAERQTIHGHLPAVTRQLAPVGRLDSSKRLRLAIGLPLRNQQELARLLDDLADPSSANYRKYLTPAQFARRFGPEEKDYQAIGEFVKAHGLTVTGTHPGRMVLDVEAGVTDIETAFHVTMRTYPHPSQTREFFAPDREPSLDLATPVLHISGLENYGLHHPKLKRQPAMRAKSAGEIGSAPDGGYGGGDFRAAYVPGIALTGAGQSVGLLELDGYFPSDITAYCTQFGLPNVSLTTVPVDGGVSSPGSSNGEVSGDIEMAISMAPGLSTIYVYEAPIDSPWDDILSQMADDNLAKQLSCSWGGGSPDATAEQIFQQMAAQGQSFFNAVGDTDAFTNSGSMSNPIEFPSDSPHITQVGATTLTTSGAGGSYVSETVWNWGDQDGQYIGSSGGVSPTYAIPTWQQGISMTGNQGSTTMRNTPDVALVGDNIYNTYHKISRHSSSPTSGLFGGTSFAAPLWAALTALVNQQAVANGQGPVGFLNPALYAIAESASYQTCFHDTTAGNNFWSPGSPTKFSAVAGYDLCSGWGTPIGSALIKALAGAPPAAITGPATGTVYNGTTLNGTVTPNGLSTTCDFRYGLTGTYGNSTAVRAVGSGTDAVPASAVITGLSPLTTYHYRLLAANSSGTASGADQTFRTPSNPPPAVATGTATGTLYNTLALTGKVNPNGAATTCFFRYGATAAYGAATTAQSVGSGTSAMLFSASITGLTGATTYHYQLVAANSSGTTFGLDQAGTTAYPPPPVTAKAASVDSATEILNATLVGYGNGVAFFQYGLTKTYGFTTGSQQFFGNPGSQALSAEITGFVPAARYYYRVVVMVGSRAEYGPSVSFVTPPTFPLNAVAAHGGMPPGVPNTKFLSFGDPAIDGSDDVAFQAVVSGTAAAAPGYSALFVVKGGTGAVTEIASTFGSRAAAPDASGSTGQTGNFAAFGDPLFNNNGDLAFLATLKTGGSVNLGNNSGIWATTGGTVRLIARKGTTLPAPDQSAGVRFASFSQLALPDNGGPVFVADLAAEPGQIPKNNQGIWVTGTAGELERLVGTGSLFAGGTVGSVSVLTSPANVAGQTRSFDSAGDLIFAATFANHEQGIYTVAPDRTISLISQTLGSAPIGSGSASFVSFGSPIFNSTGNAAFQATLSGSGIALNNNTGIWAETGTAGSLALVARLGVPASYIPTSGTAHVTGAFTALGNPVFNAGGQVAFIGTVKIGTGMGAASFQGIWITGTSSLELSQVAWAQQQAPGCGGAKFSAFVQLVLPDQGGAVFVADLAGPGITAANNQGIWAVDTSGQLNLVARKGDILSVGGAGATKTIASLSIFSLSPGAGGQTRSFNSAGDLVFKATFTDSTQTIYSVVFP